MYLILFCEFNLNLNCMFFFNKSFINLINLLLEVTFISIHCVLGHVSYVLTKGSEKGKGGGWVLL